MKISKSELQKIINEEVYQVLAEGGLGDVAAGGMDMLKTGIGAFARGFMGTGAASDNPLSRGVHSAYGATIISEIDKLLLQLEKKLEELDSDQHAEEIGNKLRGREITNPTTGVKQREKPDEITEFIADTYGMLVEDWLRLTAPVRQP